MRSSDRVIIDDISTDFSTFDELLTAMIQACNYSDIFKLKYLNRKILLNFLIKIFKDEIIF